MDHSSSRLVSPDDAQAMPQVTFSTFILSLASTAMVQLGEVPNPESGQLEHNLALGKHTIDVLDMLRTKTLSCLDEEEQRLLDGILYELRMKYVLKTPTAPGAPHA
jgi:hypothetical protein